MILISTQLILIVLAALARLTVAAPFEVNEKVIDGYFTMCMRPNFSTEWYGDDWACEYRVPWISAQCYPTPKSLNGYVMSARPEDDFGARCAMFSNADCTGRVTPTIKGAGLSDFGALGYHGDTLSWGCDCGETCVDAEATLTASFDPNATNVPITLDSGTPHPPAATQAA